MSGTNQNTDLDGAQPPSEIHLHTVRGDKKLVWRVQFVDDILSLVSPEDRVVMMLPREEAARHMRFHWDVVHGGTVAFVVLQGLKAHAFKCTPADRDRFLAWLPKKPAEARALELRFHAVALVLFGMLQLYFAEVLFPVCGALLQTVALIVLLRPSRPMHGLLGAVMLFAGFTMLFSPQVFSQPADDSLVRLAGTVSGSFLLLWGIQQFSLLGANYQLRSPLRSADEGEPGRSRLVQRVAVCAILSALAYGAYAAGLFAATRSEATALNDVFIFAALSLLGGLAALVLLLRKRPPYLEARITAQLLIIVAVLYLSGIAAGLSSGEPFTFASDILSTGILRFDRPYVWAPLIVLLVLFQRWFLRRVEREVEEEMSA